MNWFLSVTVPVSDHRRFVVSTGIYSTLQDACKAATQFTEAVSVTIVQLFPQSV